MTKDQFETEVGLEALSHGLVSEIQAIRLVWEDEKAVEIGGIVEIDDGCDTTRLSAYAESDIVTVAFLSRR